MPKGLWAAVAWLFLGPLVPVMAHDVGITRATGRLEADGTVRLTVQFDLAGLMVGQLHATPDAMEDLRGAGDQELEALWTSAWQSLQGQMKVSFDGRPASPRKVSHPDLEAFRRDLLSVAGPGLIPVDFIYGPVEGAKTLEVSFPEALGPVLLGWENPGVAPFFQLLPEGEFSAVALGGSASSGPGFFKSAGRYLWLGYEHILPRGLDHILFVLGLFLLSPKMGPLLWQVTAFTVAHTLTLILAGLGLVTLPASVVEPLIALSIAWVAVENVITGRLKPWRPAVVFGFGLLHGLGFAGVLAQQGLPRDGLVTGLLAFNVGVELGQLTVIGIAFALVGWWRHRPWYRQAICVPLSCSIAAVGVVWTVQRLFA